MPYYEMKLNWIEKMGEIAQAVVGRKPVAWSDSGRGRIMCVEFDPPLTSIEEEDFFNALPEWIRKLYSFEEIDGTIRPSVT